MQPPVSFPFLDFSTLERRRFYGEEEVCLNRGQAFFAIALVDDPIRVITQSRSREIPRPYYQGPAHQSTSREH